MEGIFVSAFQSQAHHKHTLSYKQTTDGQRDSSPKLGWKKSNWNRQCPSLRVNLHDIYAPMTMQKYTKISLLACSSAGHFAVRICDVWMC